MAKHNTRAHGRNDSKLIVKIILAFMLLVAIAVASVFVTGFAITGTANPANWKVETSKPTDPTDKDPAGDEEHGDMILAPGIESGLRLATARIATADYEDNGILPQAETAYTLTATVYNSSGSAEGMPQLVNFEASWVNSSTSGNVNDYISISKLTENSASISCLKAFPAPILITVTAANSDVSATKRCEYVKRLNYLRLDYISAITVDMPTNISTQKTYGTGTLQGEIVMNNVTFTLESSFITALTNSSYYKYFKQRCTEKGVNLNLNANSNEIVVEKDYNTFTELNFLLTDILRTTMSEANITTIINQVGLDYFKYAVIDAANKINYPIMYSIDYSYKYNETTYSSDTVISGPPVAFDVSPLGTLPAASGVELNGGNDNFIF